MASTEEIARAGAPHHIIVENRRALHISGVADVDSFDEETVTVLTTLGALTVRGRELQIQHLNVESGDLALTGEVDSLAYTGESSRRGGVRRWFR